MSFLKLISLNIEGDNHYDKILPFFETEQPDVMCLQELYEQDIPYIEEKTGLHALYLQLSSVTQDNPYRKALKGSEGVGIFTKFPIVDQGSAYYESEPANMELLASQPNAGHRGFLWADIQIDEDIYRIVTTHFTWSPNGSVTTLQQADMRRMLQELKSLGEIILCGDFNAPRGKEIFDTIAQTYIDNLPADTITTIDWKLHRTGKQIEFVVDGLFTSHSYEAQEVRVVSGVSDHCALVGKIHRKETA